MKKGTPSYRYKKMTVERWNSEWGRIGKEGNLWCLGSSRKNWEMVMGESKWGWFCESSPDFSSHFLGY